MTREASLKKDIIRAGARCARLGLVTARAGNISCRLDAATMLITATGSALGSLEPSDIVRFPLDPAVRKTPAGRKKPSSEFPLHRLIYLNFPGDHAVVHCHPGLVNAYFCVNSRLKNLTLESRFYLGDVPVVPQSTLTVTSPLPVIRALRGASLVVLRNHGVFSRGPDCVSALERVEILEEAVRVYACARLFGKQKCDRLDAWLKKTIGRG